MTRVRFTAAPMKRLAGAFGIILFGMAGAALASLLAREDERPEQ